PRGTRKIQFYWEGGNLKPRLFGPEGKLVAEIDSNGRYVSIPVPEGADGHAWHFERFAPRFFWMTNVPNYFAASPEALLVPREALKP
ncbi:MAG: hypothetical protein KDN19_19800, partial [Verrucomicrobiae bacterium]|nr:hypothetical protein [Verrucomicrobiae bacterium]